MHRRRGVGEEIANDRAVGSASERGVEIHHVQPLKPIAGPAACDIARIAQADLFLLEISSDELYDTALAKIYGRNGEHVL